MTTSLKRLAATTQEKRLTVQLIYLRLPASGMAWFRAERTAAIKGAADGSQNLTAISRAHACFTPKVFEDE